MLGVLLMQMGQFRLQRLVRSTKTMFGAGVMAFEAVELTALVLESTVQTLLVLISAGIGGDEGLGRPALGAVLDQKDLAVALRRGGRDQFLAGVTE